MFNFDETAETSQTTISSTGEQPPVQPITEVPEIIQKLDAGYQFIRGKWTLAELKKVKRTRAKIIAMYKALKRPNIYNAVRHLAAVEFFQAEWPKRSPYATYQKAHNLKGKKFFVI